MSVLDELRKVQRLRGDTYSSAEVVGLVGKAADEIESLRATLRNIVAIDEHRSGELRDAFDMAREALSG